MNTQPDRRFKVLFVDDEEQALKYFRRAFEKEFDVLTANSVAAAMELLDREGDSIGILLTDQRMPKQTGVDLLRHVRENRPSIVRILTTAYADLDSAVEAVNSGEIFRYVSKPWDVRELRGVLLRALDYASVQRDRDLLLCEKLSVMQRMLVLDRVRSLAVFAASLEGRLRYPLHGLKAYLQFASSHPELVSSQYAAGWEDLWAVTVDESQQMLRSVKHVLGRTQPTKFAPKAVSALLQEACARAGGLGQAVDASADDAGFEVVVDTPMIVGLIAEMAAWIGALDNGGNRVRIEAAHAQTDTGPGIAIHVRGNGIGWSKEQTCMLMGILRHNQPEPTEPSLDLLAGFLIAAHHGGAVTVSPSSPDGPELCLTLPADAGAAQLEELEPYWLEAVLEHVEA